MKGEEGFTLIEIIAVLIVLGILAAVAVPRYMSVTADAKNSAAMGAVAEGKARVSQYAAHVLLTSGGTWPVVGDYTTVNLGADAGDFDLGYTGAGTVITVGATGKDGGPVGVDGVASATMMVPGATY